MANNTVDMKFITEDSQLDKSVKKLGSIQTELKRLVALEQKGSISTDQFNKRVGTLATQFQKAAGGSIQARNAILKLSRDIYQASKATDTLSESQKRLATSTQVTGKKTSRFGVLAQQTGYQVGDFAVQVQSGQNVMVAFGQQATQLVGTFSMLAKSTKMISIFAGLGIVIPILSGLAAAFMRARKAADETADSAEDLDNKLKSLKSTLEDYANTMEALRQGVSLEELFATEGVDEATQKLKDAQAALAKLTTSAALTGQGAAGGIDLVSLYKSITGADTETVEALKAVIAARTQLQLLLDKEAATKFANFSESRKNYLDEIELLRAIEQHGEGSAQARQVELDQELRLREEAIDKQVEALDITVAHGVALKLQARLVARLNSEIASNTALDRLREEIAARHQNLVLLEIEATAGKDSVQYRDELVRIELERLGVLYSQHEGSAQLIQDAIELYAATLDGKVATEAVADAAANISPALQSAISQATAFANEMSRAAGAIAGIGSTTAGINAQIAALEGGASQAEARARGAAATERDRLVNLSSLGSGQTGPDAAMTSIAIDRQVQERYEAELERNQRQGVLSELNRPSSSSSSSGGSGSKSDAEVMQEKITKLQEQLSVERELIGASEARVKVVRALGLEFVQNNPQVVEGLQEQINKNLELVQVEKDRQSVLDTIESSMSNGFMSMVEGTKSVKDAFRDMAKDIIKQLYDVYVIQKMVGAVGEGGAAGTGIMGFLGSILGRASGGTVMSNQPYLVGEKGPELIVPRNRGHVMNADLTSGAMGGGGSVVVNQSFNFQANGDDSVKKIIAQAAPSIANMAKQSVMDARRRGGSMKNTFG